MQEHLSFAIKVTSEMEGRNDDKGGYNFRIRVIQMSGLLSRFYMSSSLTFQLECDVMDSR